MTQTQKGLISGLSGSHADSGLRMTQHWGITGSCVSDQTCCLSDQVSVNAESPRTREQQGGKDDDVDHH